MKNFKVYYLMPNRIQKLVIMCYLKVKMKMYYFVQEIKLLIFYIIHKF